MAIEYSADATREASHQQMRGFYVLILAGLITIFLAKNTPGKSTLAIIMMAIIGVMYGLEVHQLDLYERYRASVYVYSDAINDLVDSLNTSGIWYKFDYSEMKAAMKSADSSSIRWTRKALKATHPSYDQLAIYVFPFLLLFIWFFRRTKAPRPPNP
jgi:hypothetical protein